MFPLSRNPFLSLPLFVAAVLLLAGGSALADEKAADRVRLVKTPDGGIQPQAVVDAKGGLHLLYFKGNPASGDLFYVNRGPGDKRFSAPLRVNSQPGSAIAIGSIRGGQIAIGKGGRVHVAWNGSGKALPAGPKSNPMLYSRMKDDNTAFEPQRNLMMRSTALDGGGTVAADDAGNVFVAWHGLPVDSDSGEGNRTVWLARSTDDGKTFSRETSILPKPTGTCGCCGMKIYADDKGDLFVLYRAATATVHRDMHLLFSSDHGKRFRDMLDHPWRIGACPMSSETFTKGAGRVLGAWDTAGQVYFTRIAPKTGKAGTPQPVPGLGRDRKHPAIAVNGKGEMLVVWTEGTGWERGGALVWQLYDHSKATAQRGRVEGGIPVWGLPAAVAQRDGTFLIFH